MSSKEQRLDRFSSIKQSLNRRSSSIPFIYYNHIWSGKCQQSRRDGKRALSTAGAYQSETWCIVRDYSVLRWMMARLTAMSLAPFYRARNLDGCAFSMSRERERFFCIFSRIDGYLYLGCCCCSFNSSSSYLSDHIYDLVLFISILQGGALKQQPFFSLFFLFLLPPSIEKKSTT